MGPRNFRKIKHPAPLVRARALSLGDRRPDTQVLPALLGRLNDNDPVVRLAAHEELKRRTGRDFGYLPWATSNERSSAISRWRAWLTGRKPAPVQGLHRDRTRLGASSLSPGKSFPTPTPQSFPTPTPQGF